MRLLRLVCLVGFAMALVGPANVATYVVAQQDPRANDDGPGATERPWKTLAKAAETARAGRAWPELVTPLLRDAPSNAR